MFDQFIRCYKHMRKQGNSQKTFHQQQGVTKPKLLESNGRRPNHNKIAIYSNKYLNLVSTQSLQEDSTRYTTSNSLLRSDNGSVKMTQTSSKKFSGNEKYSQHSTEFNKVTSIDQNLLTLIQEKINSAKVHYQTKMRDILDSNARVISELRQILFQQQKQLIDKQKIIQQIIMNKGGFQGKAASSLPVCNHKKLKLGQYQYLKDRVKDLQAKLQLVLNEIGNGDEEVSMRLGRLEDKLIRYNGIKLAECRYRLEEILSKLTEKLQSFQKIKAFQNPLNEDKQKVESSLCEVRQSMQEFRQQMSDFSRKEWAYEPSSIGNLRNLLFNINRQIEGSPFKNDKNKNHGGYFMQDDDQFFYPSTDRPYSAEDYQHFQEDSQEECEKKENCSPNKVRSFFKNFS